MDELAKKIVDVTAISPSRFWLPGRGTVELLHCWKMYDQKQIADHLHNHINSITIVAHWDKKMRYKAGQSSMIDYEMADRVICSLPKVQQQWVAQLAAHFLPYSINMKR